MPPSSTTMSSRRSSTVHLTILVLCSWVIYHVALDAQKDPPEKQTVPAQSVAPLLSEPIDHNERHDRKWYKMVADQWFPSHQTAISGGSQSKSSASTAGAVITRDRTRQAAGPLVSSSSQPPRSERPLLELETLQYPETIVSPTKQDVNSDQPVEQPAAGSFSVSANTTDSSVKVQTSHSSEKVTLSDAHGETQPTPRMSSTNELAKGSFKQLPPLDPNLVEVVRNHEQYSLLHNFEEDLPFQQGSQIPYFWHIHKSGGSSMKHIMTCLERTQTRRMTLPECNDKESDVKVCKLEWGSVINADASSIDGIERIVRLKLVERNFDKFVLDTSRVYEALGIMSPQHRGRLFLVLRDPVERAISKFYYTKVATWERNYKPEVQNMTMLEYGSSNYCYNNWVTRRLIDKMVGDLEPRDLAMAKEILRQKALILLTSNMLDAGERLLKYFGWGATPYQHSCIRKFAVEEPINTNPHPIPSPDSPEWKAIRQRNLYDVDLYEFAKRLYHHQTNLLDELASAVGTD